MNKKEFFEAVARRADVDRRTAKRVLRAVFSPVRGEGVLADTLELNERVTITGFGTFEVRQRESRKYHDPRTGRSRRLRATYVAAFRPGVPLKDRIRIM